MMKTLFPRRTAALGCAAAALALAALAGCAASSSSTAAGAEASLDPLTGLEAQYPGQRAVAVVIENGAANTTQWGLSGAEVVLEALTEQGESTSLCLVYPAVSAVPKVGPVAAGRELYWRLLSAQQVLPVQRGGGTYNANYLEYYNLTAVDAHETGLTAFECAAEWSNAPLWYTSGQKLASAISELSVSAELSAAGKTVLRTTAADGSEQLEAPPLLPFSSTGRTPDKAEAQPASTVRLSFDKNNSTAFVYDADTGLYNMCRADGTPQMDADTGEQAAFDNLLVLYSTPSLRDDGKTLDYDLSVGGGVWFYGGAAYSITWQPGSETTLAFYDEDGKALEIAPGRSYIALVASLTGDEVVITE